MLIYRLHYKDDVTRGVYRGSISGVSTLLYSGDCTRHPLPSEDARLKDEWRKLLRDYEHFNWRFGFSSKEQLKSWVYKSEWREEFEELGVIMSLFKFDHIIEGDTQAIFDFTKDWEVIEEIQLTQV